MINIFSPIITITHGSTLFVYCNVPKRKHVGGRSLENGKVTPKRSMLVAKDCLGFYYVFWRVRRQKNLFFDCNSSVLKKKCGLNVFRSKNLVLKVGRGKVTICTSVYELEIFPTIKSYKGEIAVSGFRWRRDVHIGLCDEKVLNRNIAVSAQ